MSAPVAALQLAMKDQFKIFALKTIILQEDQRIHSTLGEGRGGERHTKESFPLVGKMFYYVI